MKERQSAPTTGFWRRLSRQISGSGHWVLAGARRGGAALRRFFFPVTLGMIGGAALVIVALALILNQGVPSPVGPGFLGQLSSRQGQPVPGESAASPTETSGGQTAATSVGQVDQESTDSVSPELTPQVQATMLDWAWPVRGPVQEKFGWFQHPIYQDWRLHAGIDLQVAPGTAVKAAAAGKVSSIFNDPVNSLTVVIDHGNGVESLYGGLAQLNVKVGQELTGGEILGRAGSAQTPDGRPYLFFAIKAGGEYIDPLPLLPAGQESAGESGR
ncbi:MAG: M23 family metallopeptidase [Limnochordales bacterium]|nr:M23 family metallopeptidase [Limnochordales bacterium]